MATNTPTIEIKFKPSGDKELINAINKLNEATQRLKNQQKKLSNANQQLGNSGRKAARGVEQVANQARLAILPVRNLRNMSTGLAMSFSVMRSKMLLAAFAFGLFSRGVVDTIKVSAKQETVLRRLALLLNHTGKQTGVTVFQLQQMAKTLSATTVFGDEYIHELQGMMLTYDKINKDIFPKTLELALDLSTVFGQDAKSSVTMLAKALQEPIRGLTALRRVGVSFNKEQTRLIKRFMRVGKVAEAQGIILEAVSKQVGGAAQDVAEGLKSIEQLKNAWGDFREALGEKLSPYVTDWLDKLTMVLQGGTYQPFLDELELAKNLSLELLEGDEKARVSKQMQLNHLRSAVQGNKILRDLGSEIFEDVDKTKFSYSTILNLLAQSIEKENMYILKRGEVAHKIGEISETTQRDIDSFNQAMGSQAVRDFTADLRRLYADYERGVEIYGEDYKYGQDMPAYQELIAHNAKDLIKLLSNKEWGEFGMTLASSFTMANDALLHLSGESQAFERVFGRDMQWFLYNIGNEQVMKQFAADYDDLMEANRLYSEQQVKFNRLDTSVENQKEHNQQLTEASQILHVLLDILTDGKFDGGATVTAEKEFGAIVKIINSYTTTFSNMLLAQANLTKVRTDEAKKRELIDAQEIKNEERKRKKIEDINQKYDAIERKNRKEMQAAQVAQTIANTAVAIMQVYADEAISNTFAKAALATMIGATGALQVQTIQAQKYEYGGIVGGRRHSNGGTLIEAEQGEFVLNRDAVESIGLERLNRMNQGAGGAINISFNGNVLSDDFIEEEAIPKIREAIRRGASIGIS